MSEKIESISCATCGSKDKSVFCALQDKEIQTIDDSKSCDFYHKGELVFKSGSYSKGIYCVKQGKVKLSTTGASGKEQIVRFAKSGDVMGYHSMLSKSPLSSSAYTLEDSAICFIPAKQFFEILKKESNFSMKMLELSAKNWNEASRLITNMAQKTAKQRLAEMLIWLKETFGLDEDDCIDVNLSREDLANIVGTATEALIRLLGDLKKEKLIAMKGKRIKLLDIHGLLMLADLFD